MWFVKNDCVSVYNPPGENLQTARRATKFSPSVGLLKMTVLRFTNHPVEVYKLRGGLQISRHCAV
jgi:hypothetical protein